MGTEFSGTGDPAARSRGSTSGRHPEPDPERRTGGMHGAASGPVRHRPCCAELTIGVLAGEVGIHVERTSGLDDVAGALAHVGEGRALATVVVGIR